MNCWIDVNNVNELKVGDRVRLADDRKSLESGSCCGDGCEKRMEIILHANGRIAPRCDEKFGGFVRNDIFEYYDYVQVLRELPDPPVLCIAISQDAKAYGLAGWSAHYKWMLEVDSTCKKVDGECAAEGYSELDTLRLMCSALLREKLGFL